MLALTRRLDDGSGHVAPSLQPLITSLLEMDRPKSRPIWLRNPNVVRLLRGLATGTIPLTHEGLHHEAPWRTVAHLRDLLMDSGVLQRIDRRLLLYQRWLTERLATIEGPEHHRHLRHFATWHQLRRLRTTAEKGPLGHPQTHQAKQATTRRPAQTFLRRCDRVRSEVTVAGGVPVASTCGAADLRLVPLAGLNSWSPVAGRGAESWP